VISGVISEHQASKIPHILSKNANKQRKTNNINHILARRGGFTQKPQFPTQTKNFVNFKYY
jgi:hypothetical protein